MAMHVFVVMPFGDKEGIQFDRVYGEFIKPALEEAGFEVFRADQELRAGEIRKDMFQELLLADLVVADLSIDNPNVFYEIGVRHGLRKRGFVQIGCRKDRLPFDLTTDRTLRYTLKDGAPDPATLTEEKQKLGAFARETVNAWAGWKVSPVYQLVPFLEEPAWRNLAVTDATEFWEVQRAWSSRVEAARRRNRPGDILVFAEETPTWILRFEAKRMAGEALVKLGQFKFALAQYDEALAIQPKDLKCRQQRAIMLGRTGRQEDARQEIQRLIEEFPADPETRALLGRVEKTEWVSRWQHPGRTPAEMRSQAAGTEALLLEAIEPYTEAFIRDPAQHYSGINALTLRHLHLHLGGQSKNSASLRNLEGGVLWACLSAMEREPKNYWARASFAELNVLLSGVDKVAEEYRNAVAVADRDWFKLDSTRQQLLLLRDLEFRPEVVATALAVVEGEIAQVAAPWQPRRVFLFSGHMVDKAGRTPPRFPDEPDKVARAAQAIAAKLDGWGACPDDLAICGGACGGDTLFAEACLARGARVRMHAQFSEPAFLQASVSFAGEAWLDRYDRLKAHERCSVLVQPDELGPLPRGANPYERNNLWQLYTALSYGPDRVRFLGLWDGKGGDGPGGTKHMIETVERYSGRTAILKTTELW